MTIIGKVTRIERIEEKGFYYIDVDYYFRIKKNMTATVRAHKFDETTNVGDIVYIKGNFIKSLQEDLELFDINQMIKVDEDDKYIRPFYTFQGE